MFSASAWHTLCQPKQGERRGLGASLRGLGGGGGSEELELPFPIQCEPTWMESEAPPPPIAGGIPEPEGSRGWSCPSALTPEIPEPGGRGLGLGASGRPAHSDPTWLRSCLPERPPACVSSSGLSPCSQLCPSLGAWSPPTDSPGQGCVSPTRLGTPEVGVQEDSSLPSAPVPGHSHLMGNEIKHLR